MVQSSSPARRRPGRPSRIDRQIIADAAIGLIADEGVDALTLQNIAARLGVKHTALYRHVDGRPDLLRAVADRFMESTQWPTPNGTWQDYLRDVAAAIDASCGRYPGMMDLIYNQVWPMPERLILAALDMTQHLVTLGFPQDLAFIAADLVADFAADTRIRRDRISTHTEHWTGFTDAVTPAHRVHPELQSAFEQHFAAGPDAWTDRKLDVIIAGIETMRNRRSDEHPR
ncbi:TetR/AcrR family transcriptional regulator [Leucobacter sp. M11]|uniref:TetR/AcrR family transcriptional regulator n=1 Tax=Leucobacter sp. M11 TaxID=2993565 RepID=UPI002D80B891|nr:TetR family transcriptional regulator [Leucobacter sp. M11]MEB4613389.1 TetR family transcriptional regulator [Leucobacter sp. M11]